MFEQLASFASVFPKFPLITKLLLGGWVLYSAIALIVTVNTYPSENKDKNDPDTLSLKEQVSVRIKAALTVESSLAEKYQDIASRSNSGMARLIGDGRAELEGLGLRGGGAYYSFISRTHQYGNGSDIKLQNGQFHVGFAGLDFGYFLSLGQRSPRLVIETGTLSNAPTWLDQEKREAWNYLWTFRPPSSEPEIRSIQQRRSIAVGGALISDSSPVIEGEAYLLRSVGYRESDILVLIFVDSMQTNGDCILFWRILKTFDVPNVTEEKRASSGPEHLSASAFNQTSLTEAQSTVLGLWRTWLDRDGVTSEELNGLVLPPEEWMNDRLANLGRQYRVRKNGAQFEIVPVTSNAP